MQSYAKSTGIDIDRYYPVGLSFYVGEHGSFYLNIIYIDLQIQEVYKQANNGRTSIVKFRRNETIANFFDHIKRFEVVLNAHGSGFGQHEVYQHYNEKNELEE